MSDDVGPPPPDPGESFHAYMARLEALPRTAGRVGPRRPPNPEEVEMSPEAAAINEDMVELRRKFDDIVNSFPEGERDLAARQMYLDGDGNPATRYGRLRGL